MEYFLERIAPLRLGWVNSEKKICICYSSLFSFDIMYQCLNGAIISRKYSIKAPPKRRNSVYVLTEICHQRSKWLRPIRFFFQIRQSHSLGNFGCYIFSIITWRGCVIVNRVFPSSELNLWMWWMNRKYPITVTKIGIEIG